jgi:hypothetical protein
LCPLHNTLVGFVEHPDVPEVVKYLAETGSTALNLLFLAVHDLGVPDPFSRRR